MKKARGKMSCETGFETGLETHLKIRQLEVLAEAWPGVVSNLANLCRLIENVDTLEESVELHQQAREAYDTTKMLAEEFVKEYKSTNRKIRDKLNSKNV